MKIFDSLKIFSVDYCLFVFINKEKTGRRVHITFSALTPGNDYRGTIQVTNFGNKKFILYSVRSTSPTPRPNRMCYFFSFQNYIS